MDDATAVLTLIGTGQARHLESLRTEAQLGDDEFDAAVEVLRGRDLVSDQDGGLVRTLPELSERADRILTALPEDGATRSGTLVAKGLGMRVGEFKTARAELKRNLLVKTGQGRGAGTVGRIPSRGSKYEERLRLLGEELRVECEVDAADAVLEELFAAASMEPHEGVYPSYAALVVEDSEWSDLLVRAAEGAYTVIDLPLALAPSRKFADGMTAFLARNFSNSETRLLLAPVFRGLERDAVELAAQLGATVVQRTRPGIVRLVDGERIAIRENGSWNRKTAAEALLGDVVTAIGDESKRPVAARILSLCLHVLSANHVGATVVWFPNQAHLARTGSNKVPHIGWSKAFAPPRLTVTDPQHAPLFLHALSQLDRAALLNSDGELQWLGANLDAPPAAEVEGGTRHNSAASYSEARADAMLFVVSADGPVTVFKEGYVVRTTRR